MKFLYAIIQNYTNDIFRLCKIDCTKKDYTKNIDYTKTFYKLYKKNSQLEVIISSFSYFSFPPLAPPGDQHKLIYYLKKHAFREFLNKIS